MKKIRSKRIVITGGPGTGKTALIRHLEASGYYCLHEIIREMTLEAKNNGTAKAITNPLAFVPDPLDFNRKILQGRIQQFWHAEDLQDPIVFYDRGIPDVIAYMRYFEQEYDHSFQEPCEELRYDKAVVLPPWKAIYRQDEERMERFEEAVEIHHLLVDTYENCGYEVLRLEPGTLEERAAGLLEMIRE